MYGAPLLTARDGSGGLGGGDGERWIMKNVSFFFFFFGWKRLGGAVWLGGGVYSSR